MISLFSGSLSSAGFNLPVVFNSLANFKGFFFPRKTALDQSFYRFLALVFLIIIFLETNLKLACILLTRISLTAHFFHIFKIIMLNT